MRAASAWLPRASVQRAGDEPALEGLDLGAQAGGGGALGAASVRALPSISRIEGLAVRERDQTLDGVLQLAHVAGPGPRRQPREQRRGGA